MVAWLTRRLFLLVPTLVAIVCLSFVLVRLAPGSPFASDKTLHPVVRAALDQHFGLDQPLHTQLWRYLCGVVQGDLGPSLRYPQHQVAELMAQGLPHTAFLAVVALAFGLVVGSSLGMAGAWTHLQQQRRRARAIHGVISLLQSCPSFVLGPLLIFLFALGLGLVPPAGWGRIEHVILPGLTLGAVLSAQIARLVRHGLLEASAQPFVNAARAKGLSEHQIMLRHLIWPALVPLISYLGPTIGGLMVGSVAVERIFLVPGLGMFFVDAAFNRDYFVVMGIVLLESVCLLLAQVLVDLGYAWLDPRVRPS